MEHEAMLWEPIGDSTAVQCGLCAHRCIIAEGKLGVCRVRRNKDGKLITLAYGQTIARHADPIEKKPLFHFYPGSQAYSIATPGCNLRCSFCQNWEISQLPRFQPDTWGQPATPAEIVQAALELGCRSVAYTYTEPTIFAEYALDTARLAHEAGLKNVFVSNGFMSPELLPLMAGTIDAINVDLKAGRGDFYRRLSGAELQPVLDNLVQFRRLGIWLEVTTLVIPGLNDSDDELEWMASYLKQEVGADVPWHISRFHPDYRMTEAPVTPAESLQRARDIGLAAGLRYVYVGNLPGHDGESTRCATCGALLISRFGCRMLQNRLLNGACPNCHTPLPGMGMAAGENC